jgi:oligoribonuclease NrnB/cAMP/cGMP phosphodiesterase (DHH superfamily)
VRIVTRPDFDGIVCAVLLIEALDIREPVEWVEPNQIHRGLIDIQPGDIIANMAFDERCSLWFDHHLSNRIDRPFQGCFQVSPSAARIIFEYYHKEFIRDFSPLVQAADKIDSADLSLYEVLNPENYPYIMLSSTIHSFRISDRPYWDRLVNLLRSQDINQILKDPEVKKRTKSVIIENRKYLKVLQENTRIIKQVSITDFRSFETYPGGSRFLVFSIYPDTSVNLKIRFDATNRDTVIVSIGHSIFNKTCQVNIGALCSRFGGGGHHGAGSCSFSKSQSEKNIKEIIDVLISNQKNEDTSRI